LKGPQGSCGLNFALFFTALAVVQADFPCGPQHGRSVPRTSCQNRQYCGLS